MESEKLKVDSEFQVFSFDYTPGDYVPLGLIDKGKICTLGLDCRPKMVELRLTK